MARGFGNGIWSVLDGISFGSEQRLASVVVVFFIGIMLGGLAIGVWGGFRNKSHTMALSTFLLGIDSIGLGLITNFWLYLVCMGLKGVIMNLFNPPMMATLQTNVDGAYMGRVFSVLAMMSSVMMPLGMVLWGPIGDVVAIDWLLIGTGIGVFLMGFVFDFDKTLLKAGMPTQKRMIRRDCMSKVIPILPCENIDKQCAFYESVGFTTIAKYKAPNAYAVVQHKDVTLHFWGSKKYDPSENACMVFIEVDDADRLNAELCVNIKREYGKMPRTGIPRITKVCALKDDKRFTLCDPADDTLYFGTPNNGVIVAPRTLDNERYTKSFAVIYDLLHSHENPGKAAKALSGFMRYEAELNDSDKEKLAVLVSEIEDANKSIYDEAGKNKLI